MSQDARIRIDSHRLMRPHAEAVPDHVLRLEDQGSLYRAQARMARRSFLRRFVWHVVLFCVAFVFTTGALVLAVLLWVRPDSFGLLVAVGLGASALFVGVFAALRMLVFHALIPDSRAQEPDRGLSYHLSKSVAYGFVALAVALALMGLIVNLAQ